MTARHKTALTRPSDHELVYTRSFDAPRELVWSAWTDPAQLARWWGPNGFSITTHEHRLEPRGIWKLTMHGPDGRDYPNTITFEEIVPPQRLVYRHLGEAGDEPVRFTTTVTFEEHGGVTTVVMRQDFGSAQDLEFVVKTYEADKGGVQTIGRLATHVDMLTSEHPEFLVTRVFDAPREVVWRAWTDPAQLVRWFGPQGCETRLVKFELAPGGTWHSCMTMPDGTQFWGRFVFREVVPGERLAWLHSFSDAGEGLTRHPMSPTWPLVMLTTVRFEACGEKTRITVSWTPIEASPEEIATFVAGMSGMNLGWSGSFLQLDEFLAGV